MCSTVLVAPQVATPIRGAVEASEVIVEVRSARYQFSSIAID
jgi:hypothetical protein